MQFIANDRIELKGRFKFVEYLRMIRMTRPAIVFEEKETKYEVVRRVLKDERDFVASPDFTRKTLWICLRTDILEVKEHFCKCCNSDGAGHGGLNVDHKRNRRNYPQTALLWSNLQILCGVCNEGKGNRCNTDWEQRRPAIPVPGMPSAVACAELSALAPGRDHAKLLSEYRRFRSKRRDQVVRDPDKAFLAWVMKVTKGMPSPATALPRRDRAISRAGKPTAWTRGGRRPSAKRRPSR